MILHPSILALLLSSLLICLMMLYATGNGIVILRRWDIASGSELQLTLERRTHLISTIVSYFLMFQLVSLFLFVRTADGISHMLVGAMCAAGTLSAAPLGYTTLMLKVTSFIMAGLWLILNHADNLGHDYPLLRAKYLLLLIIAPFVLAEGGGAVAIFYRTRSGCDYFLLRDAFQPDLPCARQRNRFSAKVADEGRLLCLLPDDPFLRRVFLPEGEGSLPFCHPNRDQLSDSHRVFNLFCISLYL